MIPYHTPAELRQFSNLGHVVEGILLGAVALVALAQAFGYFRAGRARYVLPGLLMAAGLFLPALMLVHPSVEIMRAHAAVILADPQQQQHLAMALLLLGAGVAEAVAIRRPSRVLRTVWPLSLASIGMLFLLHPQHGTGDAVEAAALIHRVLGAVCIAAAASGAVAVWSPRHRRWADIASPLLLLAAASLLISYREPPGAYEQVPTHTTHGATDALDAATAHLDSVRSPRSIRANSAPSA